MVGCTHAKISDRRTIFCPRSASMTDDKQSYDFDEIAAIRHSLAEEVGSFALVAASSSSAMSSMGPVKAHRITSGFGCCKQLHAKVFDLFKKRLENNLGNISMVGPNINIPFLSTMHVAVFNF
ncbi:1,4-dihydroxy-2-naphthoate octaprenyltransferase [Anopheles sinensis]|uniref:1,4-dihydroxy-2-naphthoate octaprenyltransferase n=1 Tax=Anopheles sinensis TaxID=74873 RepID=A0A084VGC2_ANOSI|nr:1,4-dihydroxy-2-naphthoate octaprenyltransferase [Anopheles sinensis]